MRFLVTFMGQTVKCFSSMWRRGRAFHRNIIFRETWAEKSLCLYVSAEIWAELLSKIEKCWDGKKKKKGKKSKWEFSTEDMKHVVHIPCLPWEKIRTSTSDTCMSSFVSFLGNSWWTLSNRNPEVIFFLIIFQILGFLIYKVSS